MRRPWATLPLLALLVATAPSACTGGLIELGAPIGAAGDDASSDAGHDAAAAEASGDDADADASLDDPPIPAAYQAFADAFDAERIKFGAPGAAVALLENGRVTFAHGFGNKGPNSTERVRARTLFRIGSMTKALTSTALLKLVQNGKADLSQPLLAYVPDVAIDGPELTSLTLHDLVS